MATCVRILLGCYRQGEAQDAEIYIKAISAVLAQYPEDVVRGATDPRSGLPSKCQFLPTVFDVSNECERRMKPLRDAEYRRQLEEDAKADAPAPLSDDDLARRRAFIAKWREEEATRAAKVAAAAGEPLHLMDARKCKGELKELVQGALEGHLAHLKAQFDANPPQASTRLLVMLGIDPLGKGMGNAVIPWEDRFDDALP